MISKKIIVHFDVHNNQNVFLKVRFLICKKIFKLNFLKSGHFLYENYVGINFTNQLDHFLSENKNTFPFK